LNVYATIPTITISQNHLNVGQRIPIKDISIDLEQFHKQWLGNALLPLGKFTPISGICPGKRPIVNIIRSDQVISAFPIIAFFHIADTCGVGISKCDSLVCESR